MNNALCADLSNQFAPIKLICGIVIWGTLCKMKRFLR
jgi:hypothetical protein